MSVARAFLPLLIGVFGATLGVYQSSKNSICSGFADVKCPRSNTLFMQHGNFRAFYFKLFIYLFFYFRSLFYFFISPSHTHWSRLRTTGITDYYCENDTDVLRV